MASKKTQPARTGSISIEVVSNGYKVKAHGGQYALQLGTTGIITGYSATDGQLAQPSLSGEFVFQDIAGLISFLRKSLIVPAS